ncbi:MAG TPA: sigma 54-interacting transcriptional regulator, partial [Candidatus Kapabacteria bacterium]|nr:sigma 54-interacting transcriptional regulator [Candidatus Kapabacteria bacterium]
MKTSKVKQKLLVIDDDKTLCQTIKDEFTKEGIEVIITHSGLEGLKICSREKIDVVLLDQKLPDSHGDILCQPILKYNEQTKIIFITAFPSFDNALKAIKAGASDYLSKPFELGELHLAIDNALKIIELEKVKQFHNYEIDKEKKSNFLVGNFGEKSDILGLIDLAAPLDYPILITGETGTGKNMVAKAIHYKGADPGAPFISINCAAIPENLVEAELFGYEKGAYTGAVTTHKGVFEIADGGTL